MDQIQKGVEKVRLRETQAQALLILQLLSFAKHDSKEVLKDKSPGKQIHASQSGPVG